jgi:hypothetical protein
MSTRESVGLDSDQVGSEPNSRTPFSGSPAGSTSYAPRWHGLAAPVGGFFSILMLQFFITGHSICLP